ADLAEPPVGREERNPGRIQSRAFTGDIDVPGRARDASVRDLREEAGRAKDLLLWTGPGARRSCPADPAHPFFPGDPTGDPRHRWHEVDMPVRVPRERVVTPGARAGCLRAYLHRNHLRPDPAGPQETRELSGREKPAVLVAQRRHSRGVRNGPTADEVDVEADLELMLGKGGRGSLRGRWKGHDERCRPHHAAPVRLD